MKTTPELRAEYREISKIHDAFGRAMTGIGGKALRDLLDDIDELIGSESNHKMLKIAVAKLSKMTEGEARALVEVISCRLGFGHARDLKEEEDGSASANVETPQAQ